MSQIICNDITLGYGGRPILEGLSFKVEKGECLSIVGANGTGKSTLCRALIGLIAPTSGEILFDTGLSTHSIGYLPQRTDAQMDFPASVFEVVASGLFARRELRPFLTRREKERVREVLSELGIEELMRKSYRTLSGGQQQRVLLARALLASDELLLLDEPTASLDPTATQDFYRLIRRLQREKGVTVLMVTHDLDAIRNGSDHILHLGRRSPFFGTLKEYEASDAGREYLSLLENEREAGSVGGDGI